MRKKLFNIVLSAIMVIAMAVPAFAASVNPFIYDPRHGYEFRIYSDDVSAANGWYEYRSSDVLLNCHTNGKPVSGTKISTWSRTGSNTQKWYEDTFPDGRITYRPIDNAQLALNVNRSSIGSVCDVIFSETNIYDDYAFFKNYIIFNLDKAKLNIKFGSRYNHTQDVYLTYSSTGSFCTWQYKPTNGIIKQNQILYLANTQNEI